MFEEQEAQNAYKRPTRCYWRWEEGGLRGLVNSGIADYMTMVLLDIPII